MSICLGFETASQDDRYQIVFEMIDPTYASTIDRYRFEYDQQLYVRHLSPFLVPIDVLNFVLLLSYLTCLRRPSFASTILVYLAIVGLSVRSIMRSRSTGLAYGVLIGISSSWCMLLSFNLLFLHRPAETFKRKIARRVTQNDTVKNVTCGVETNLEWQHMPSALIERLFWVLDLLGSLRGLHWSYGHLWEPSGIDKSSAQIQSTFRISYGKLLLTYLCIDCLKEVIALDPYFWGYTDHEPPNYIKSRFQNKGLVQAYRMVVAFAVLYIAIVLTTTLGLLLFVRVLGPSFAGTWGQHWAHRPQIGTLNSISINGLKGWWGICWHQMFRLTLTPPADALTKKLNIDRKGFMGRTIRLVIAFFISGVIHASGSYTMWRSTKPFNSFLFFMLQPLGILVQDISRWTLRRLGLDDRIPVSVGKVANVAFTVVWLLRTFPLLADDFARGGLWLTEPFPVSILQMLGLGSKQRIGSLSHGSVVSLYKGRNWWQVGLAP